jgi:hypothetical protein
MNLPGMPIMYHMEKDREPKDNGIEYITDLTRGSIEELLCRGVFQLSLFSKELAEVSDGEKRYVLSVNPELEASELHCYKRKKELCRIPVIRYRNFVEKPQEKK